MRRFVQALSDPGAGWPGTVADALAGLPAHYNLSKGGHAGVVFAQADHWQVGIMSWGLVPSWEPEPQTRYSTQTARLERAPRSRLYRRAWAQRRCVVPMNGYYKWDRHVQPRQPHFIQAASGEVLVAAGLWSLWGEELGTPFWSFALLTRPNAAIPPPLVPDGPCFLPVARIADWVLGDARRGQSLLLGMPQPPLESWPVGRRVADRRLDDYTLLEPVSAGEDFDRIVLPPEMRDDGDDADLDDEA
jgi:putative SOS response-associated peptidase YedK